MEFLKKIITKNLRKDSQGRTIFYPWGDFGSGFLVDSPVKEKKIRIFLYLNWILPILFIAFVFLRGDFFSNPVFLLILLVAPPIWLFVSLHLLTKNLPIYEKKPGFFESLRRRARTINIIIPLFWFLSPFYFLVTQIRTLILEQEHSWHIAYYIFHGIFLGISIGILLISGYMLFIRIFKK